MEYPVIDPVGTGNNIRELIASSGRTAPGVARTIGLSDKGTIYKWLRGETLPNIDNLLALSVLLGVTINDILAIA